MQIDIKFEGMDKLLRGLDQVKDGLGGRAMAMAINKTAAKGKVEMGRAIRDEFMVTVTEAKSKLRVTKARTGHLTAVLDPFGKTVRGRSMNLIHFTEKKVTLAEMRRRKKKGERQLKFKIKRGGGLVTIKGAFIGNKGRTIFQREGSARTPIKPVQTVGIPSMFNTKKIKRRVIHRIRKEFKVEVERAAAQVLRKAFR